MERGGKQSNTCQGSDSSKIMLLKTKLDPANTIQEFLLIYDYNTNN